MRLFSIHFIWNEFNNSIGITESTIKQTPADTITIIKTTANLQIHWYDQTTNKLRRVPFIIHPPSSPQNNVLINLVRYISFEWKNSDAHFIHPWHWIWICSFFVVKPRIHTHKRLPEKWMKNVLNANNKQISIKMSNFEWTNFEWIVRQNGNWSRKAHIHTLSPRTQYIVLGHFIFNSNFDESLFVFIYFALHPGNFVVRHQYKHKNFTQNHRQ